VPEERRKSSATRYDAIIATLVGVCALCVSGYTAYMQRQQVRATVWPILEFSSSNEPNIRLNLENKGVGPAIIRHVVVTVDGQPVRNWDEAMQKMLGPGQHYFSESTMSRHVLSAGESMNILVPHDANGAPLAFDKSNPLWTQMNDERHRVGVEICYCSTLGECWTLRSDAKGSSIVETSTCPGPSATTFQQ
jgi:hypothetical protein